MGDDPVEQIAEHIRRVDDSLDPAALTAIVGTVLAKRPPALRLLAVLDQQPALLTNGSAAMPRALERIIDLLAAHGASVVRRPACGICGQQRPVPERRDGLLVCQPCGRSSRHRTAQCTGCAAVRTRHRSAAGRDYCRPCWTTARASARDRLVGALTAAIPGLARDVAAARMLALGIGPDRLTHLAIEMEVFGSEWIAAPERGSVLFVRLYDALRLDDPRLPARVCGLCRTTTQSELLAAGVRCCRKCYRAARLDTCDGCGQPSSLERRQADGTRLCQRCTNQLDDESACCTRCGHRRLIAARTQDGPLCLSCRRRDQIDRCHRCGQQRPCHAPGTASAICVSCARRREPCSRCGASRIVHHRAADGTAVCHSCTPRIVATCTDCRREREVRGRGADGSPFCGYCWPRNPASFRDCTRCGQHTHLGRRDLCERCTADDLVDSLFPDALIVSDHRVRALRDACRSAEAATILRTFKRRHSVTLLRAVMSEPAGPSHDYLDAAGPDNATRHVRALLVEHGALPHRDEHLSLLERWITDTAATIEDLGERRAFVQFARWRHLRSLREQHQPARYAQAAGRRRELLLVSGLLSWARQQGRSLAGLTQADLDRWRAEGPRERHRVKPFLQWAHRNQLATKLVIDTNHGHPLPRTDGVPTDTRWATLARLLSPDCAAPAATKLAAAAVLLYGARVARVRQLRLSDVSHRDHVIYIQLGEEPLALPDEIASTAQAAVADRTATRMFAAVDDSEWLLPGIRPGTPVSADALTDRLKKLGIDPAQARAGALADLAQRLPPPILSRLTGLNPTAAARWATAVSATMARYAPLALKPGPRPPRQIN